MGPLMSVVVLQGLKHVDTVLGQAHGCDAYFHPAFSPDGSRFVTCGVNLGPGAKRAGAISIWALPVDRQKAQ
jgi:hypothetical protein